MVHSNFDGNSVPQSWTSAPQELAQVQTFKGMSSFQGPLWSKCTITWLYWLSGNTA